MFVLAQRSRGQVVRYTDAQARCMIKLLEKLNIIGIEREHQKTLARNETMSCLVAIGSLVLVVFHGHSRRTGNPPWYCDGRFC